MSVSPVGVSVCVCLTCASLFRSAGLAETNALLCEQLSQLEEANEALRGDLQKLTADWTRAVKEVEQKDCDWLREKEVCNRICPGPISH